MLLISIFIVVNIIIVILGAICFNLQLPLKMSMHIFWSQYEFILYKLQLLLLRILFFNQLLRWHMNPFSFYYIGNVSQKKDISLFWKKNLLHPMSHPSYLWISSTNMGQSHRVQKLSFTTIKQSILKDPTILLICVCSWEFCLCMFV